MDFLAWRILIVSIRKKTEKDDMPTYIYTINVSVIQDYFPDFIALPIMELQSLQTLLVI